MIYRCIHLSQVECPGCSSTDSGEVRCGTHSEEYYPAIKRVRRNTYYTFGDVAGTCTHIFENNVKRLYIKSHIFRLYEMIRKQMVVGCRGLAGVKGK